MPERRPDTDPAPETARSSDWRHWATGAAVREAILLRRRADEVTPTPPGA